MGAPGVEEIRWLVPVRPGDRLRVRTTVLETREPKSRPDFGFVRMKFEVLNAAGACVMQLDHQSDVRSTHAARCSPLTSMSGLTMKFFEDITIGDRSELGSHTFTTEEIKAFALKYDPQPFHIDEAAAARSHFGRLCASGWHTSAICMRHVVEANQREDEAMRRARRAGCGSGPSPGVRDVRWHQAGLSGRHDHVRDRDQGQARYLAAGLWTGCCLQHRHQSAR